MIGFPDHLLSGLMWTGTEDSVWVLLLDPDGFQVFARYAQGQWEVFPSSEASSRIGEVACASGAVDADGTLWITGDGTGFVGFDGESWTGRTDTGFCLPPVGPTAVGPDGEFWWAAESSLIRWDGETRSEWVTAETWTGDHPVTAFNFGQHLTVGGDGVVWVPTRGGLVRFDSASTSWAVISPNDGIPAVAEYASLAADASGTLWYASPDGLARIDVSMTEAPESLDEAQVRLEDLEWTEIELPLGDVEETLESDIENAGFVGAFASPDGRLFLSGSVSTYAQEYRTMTWTSTDGSVWEAVDVRVAGTEFFLEDLTTTESGYLAKGSALDTSLGTGPEAYRLEYWQSPDGITWNLLEHVPIDGTSDLDTQFTGNERGTHAPSLESAGLKSVFGAATNLDQMIILDDRIVIAGSKDSWSIPHVWIAHLP